MHFFLIISKTALADFYNVPLDLVWYGINEANGSNTQYRSGLFYTISIQSCRSIVYCVVES